MRSRILPAVGIGIIAAAIAVTYSTPASAHTAGVSTAGHGATSQVAHSSKGGEKACYAQNTNDNGTAIVSQNFESSFDAYDAQAADDFVIKKTCKVSDVSVSGLYFNGSGPCRDMNVVFYSNKKPSTIGKALKGGTFMGAGFDSGFATGSGDIELDPGITLKKGTYWVSVQCNLDFSAGGEWGWGTNNTQATDAALWENPGNGFATGCTTYSNMQTCLGLGGPDLSFSILKEAKK